MPLYDYHCRHCDYGFEARHSFSAPAPDCPKCHTPNPQRIITTTPAVVGGVATQAGSGGNATKEQLRDKWSEETPKLREKLVSKLGEETVNKYAPSLNTKYE